MTRARPRRYCSEIPFAVNAPQPLPLRRNTTHPSLGERMSLFHEPAVECVFVDPFAPYTADRRRRGAVVDDITSRGVTSSVGKVPNEMNTKTTRPSGNSTPPHWSALPRDRNNEHAEKRHNRTVAVNANSIHVSCRASRRKRGLDIPGFREKKWYAERPNNRDDARRIRDRYAFCCTTSC